MDDSRNGETHVPLNPKDDESSAGPLSSSLLDISESSKNDESSLGYTITGRSSMTQRTRTSKTAAADVEELDVPEKKEPDMKEWLHSSAKLIMQVSLFSFTVSIDAGKSLFSGNALNGTDVNPTSLVIMSSILSIVVGTSLAGFLDGKEGIRLATEWKSVKKFSTVSVFFAAAQCFQAQAYQSLTAGTIKCIGQVRLLQTAIMSVVLLGRRYHIAQWSVMIVIIFGTIVFTIAKREHKVAEGLQVDLTHAVKQNKACQQLLEKHVKSGEALTSLPTECDALVFKKAIEEASEFLGFLSIFIYLFLSDLGSIISEMFLKEDKATPFHVQKVSMELSACPIAGIMSLFMPYFKMWVVKNEEKARCEMWWKGACKDPHTGEEVRTGLFSGWGAGALLVLCFNTLGSWMSGILVKRLSTVMKLIGKVISLGIVYFLADCLFLKDKGKDPPILCSLAMTVVMGATFTFLTIKKPPSVHKREAAKRAAEEAVDEESQANGKKEAGEIELKKVYQW